MTHRVFEIDLNSTPASEHPGRTMAVLNAEYLAEERYTEEGEAPNSIAIVLDDEDNIVYVEGPKNAGWVK